MTADGRNRGDADRRAAWLQSKGTICNAWQKLEFEAENAAAGAASTGLPALSGSEKQIAWASKIRLQTLLIIDKATASVIADAHELLGNVSDAARQEFADAIALVSIEIKGQTDARFWIDHRDYIVAERALTGYLIEELRRRAASLMPTVVAESRGEA